MCINTLDDMGILSVTSRATHLGTCLILTPPQCARLRQTNTMPHTRWYCVLMLMLMPHAYDASRVSSFNQLQSGCHCHHQVHWLQVRAERFKALWPQLYGGSLWLTGWPLPRSLISTVHFGIAHRCTVWSVPREAGLTQQALEAYEYDKFYRAVIEAFAEHNVPIAPGTKLVDHDLVEVTASSLYLQLDTDGRLSLEYDIVPVCPIGGECTGAGKLLRHFRLGLRCCPQHPDCMPHRALSHAHLVTSVTDGDISIGQRGLCPVRCVRAQKTSLSAALVISQLHTGSLRRLPCPTPAATIDAPHCLPADDETSTTPRSSVSILISTSASASYCLWPTSAHRVPL